MIALLAGCTTTMPAPDLITPPNQSESACGPGDLRYDIDKTIAAMRNANGETNDLTLIAAHRGFWEFDPENSWRAIEAAGFQCAFEIVEVDVKPAANNQPVIFHDFELDRVTNGHGLLTNLNEIEFKALKLRDRHGHVMNFQPMTAQDFLSQYVRALEPRRQGNRLIGPVIALDMKAKKTDDVWPMVGKVYEQMKTFERLRHDRMMRGIVFKVEGRSISTDPAVVERMIDPSVPLQLTIVLNPPRPGERDTNDEIVNAYAGKPYVVSWEVNYRYPGDPMKKYLLDPRLKSIGTFSTYYEMPEGVGKSESPQCCGTLKSDHTQPRKDVLDYRGRWDFYLSRNVEGGRRFNLITTDRPDVVEPFLKAMSLRNTGTIR